MALLQLLLLLCLASRPTAAFSQESPPSSPPPRLPQPSSNDNGSSLSSLSRREALIITPLGVGGAFAYGKLVADAWQKLTRGNLVYPLEHEERVQETIATALLASAVTSVARPLRILEVGVGQGLRLARRGLYDQALSKVMTQQNGGDGDTSVSWTGVDLKLPPPDGRVVVQDAIRKLNAPSRQRSSRQGSIQVNVNLLQGSITSPPLPFADGYFDCVISALTLCSVDDPEVALKEIHRLVRPDGGTFGFVEHVAVAENEPYRILQWQQRFLDPLQQVVADNCHLRRNTAETVGRIFGTDQNAGNDSFSTWITQERFLVDGMWPVSCQTCGVVQRKSPS